MAEKVLEQLLKSVRSQLKAINRLRASEIPARVRNDLEIVTFGDAPG
jgi:hypothetical protein